MPSLFLILGLLKVGLEGQLLFFHKELPHDHIIEFLIHRPDVCCLLGLHPHNVYCALILKDLGVFQRIKIIGDLGYHGELRHGRRCTCELSCCNRVLDVQLLG